MNMQEWEIAAQRFPCMELKNPQGEATGTWITCVARLAFEKLTTPEDGKHSCALIFPPNADLAPLFDAAKRTAAAKWGDKAASMGLRSPFKPQPEVAGKYDGFSADGGFYINCGSKFAPNFYAADGKSKLTLSSDYLWSGCYVRAGLTCYTYDKDPQGKPVKPGVSFGLSFIQFIAVGDKFSGGIDPTEYLQPVTGIVGSTTSAPQAANGAAKPIVGALF